jgi:catechol 2,3-dioxygenase-like lactoylglutathione lyase family enzyme
VRDLKRSLSFYEQLGFRISTYDKGYGFAQRGRLILHLRVVSDLDPCANLCAVYVDVAGVDDLHREWLSGSLRAVAEDFDIRDEPTGRIAESVSAKPWGVREFSIADPDNNVLRFGEETD